MSKVRINILLIGVAFLTVLGCKKMDDTYKEFIKDGETVYISKPDSLKVYVGRERIQLQWLLISDPKVKSYKVYWNNRADSVQGTIVKTDNVDTVRVIVNNLPEGTYNFEVLQFDNYGNSSIKASIVGRTYGALYESTLYNRVTSKISRERDDVIMTFAPSDESVKQLEISYIDSFNKTKKVISGPDVESLILPDFPIGGQFIYKTIHTPDSLCIDLFSSVVETYEEVVGEVQSNKAKFKRNSLPTDTDTPEYDVWPIERLWDGITDQADRFFYVKAGLPGLQLPNWFTIDLGEERLLTKVRVNHLSHNDAWIFSSGAPRTYEIYGSNNPSPDGSFDNWQLLGSYTSVKPADYNQMIEAGRAGELQVFENNSNRYRYIRFKTLSTWGGVKNVMISELTFFEVGTTFKRIIN